MNKDDNESRSEEGFRLEEILREFGRPAEEKAPDPALRSPVIRRIVPVESGKEAREDGLPQLDLERKPPVPSARAGSKITAMPRMTRPGQPEEPEPEPAPEPPRRPRSVQTPETRWKQALERQGRRNIRLLLCLILTIGALFLGFVRSQGLLDGYPNQDLFGLGELGLLALCAICAFDVLAEGLEQLLRPGFGLGSLVLVETLAVLGEGIFAMGVSRPSFCPLMCLILTCALWGRRSRIQGLADTMDAARKADGSHALVREPGFFQKRPGVLSGKGDVQDFLDCNDRPVGAEKFLNLYGLLVVLAGLAIAALNCGGIVGTFFQYWAAVMLAGTPIMSFLIWSRPWAILARRLKAKGAALYGWPGVRRLSGKVVVPVSEGDLFPGANVKMNGVKFFNGQLPDRVVAFGAAVTAAAGSALAPIFEEQMQLRGARRFSVTTIRRYDVGGIGAEIGNESVLVGSLRFMQSMGVEMPSGTRVSQAVYVAIQGTLAGVFALHYGVTRSSVDNLAILSSVRGVTPVITAGDFIVTESFLRTKFRVNTERIKIPSMTARAELDQKQPGKNAKPALLAQEPDFGLTVSAVSGVRALNMAFRAGLALALLSGAMGLIIMGVLAGLSAGGMMSVANLTLFLLIWAVPMFLLTGWPRNV